MNPKPKHLLDLEEELAQKGLLDIIYGIRQRIENLEECMKMHDKGYAELIKQNTWKTQTDLDIMEDHILSKRKPYSPETRNRDHWMYLSTPATEKALNELIEKPKDSIRVYTDLDTANKEIERLKNIAEKSIRDNGGKSNTIIYLKSEIDRLTEANAALASLVQNQKNIAGLEEKCESLSDENNRLKSEYKIVDKRAKNTANDLHNERLKNEKALERLKIILEKGLLFDIAECNRVIEILEGK